MSTSEPEASLPNRTAHDPDELLNYTLKISDFGASICTARFWELVRQFRLYHWQQGNWPCDVDVPPDELAGESSEAAGGMCDGGKGVALLEQTEAGSAVVQCSLGGGQAQVTVAAGSREAAALALGFAREHLPVATRSDPGRIPITFWLDAKDGPSALRRMLDVPRWAQIETNYSAPTREALASLMAGFQPAKGGQLLLFHGPAGTGKTFALRAIGSEWRSWCDVHYIVDPDRFLGEARYLIEVLLARGQTVPGELDMDFLRDFLPGMPFSGGSPDALNADRWRLIVLEDTGELLSADAKERTGQSLSRLLNTVDGLIGQGLRTLILVTTNEPVKELHPAVARAGRCAAAIEFKPLSAVEGTAWLGQEVNRASTIADLYAIKGGYGGARPSLELPEEAGLPQTSSTSNPDGLPSD